MSIPNCTHGSNECFGPSKKLVSVQGGQAPCTTPENLPQKAPLGNRITVPFVFKQGLPTIEGKIQNKVQAFACDTGATISLFPMHCLPPGVKPFPAPMTISGISAQPVRLTHAVTLKVVFGGKQLSILFFLVPFVNFPALLGNSFIKPQQAIIDYENETVSFKRLGYKPPTGTKPPTNASLNNQITISDRDRRGITFVAKYTYVIPPQATRILPLAVPISTMRDDIQDRKSVV